MKKKTEIRKFPLAFIWRRFSNNKIIPYLILKIIISLSFGYLVSCSKDKTAEIPVINPESMVEKEIGLSEIAEEITYIPLSNDVLFGSIVSVELTDSMILIAPALKGLFVYDYNGNFINQIGKQGRGPGEYKYANKFTFDRNKEIVYVLDGVRHILDRKSVV